MIFNDTVESVNDKYVLSLTTEQPKADEGMYTEKVLGGGWMVLSERTDDREGKPLDLETLFNVIVEQSKGSAGGVR